MIIYTQPGIVKFNPTKISKTATYAGTKYCVAEVPDDFDITEEEMNKNDIDFWWEVAIGMGFALEHWDANWKSKGGFYEMSDSCFSITKPRNVAGIMAEVSAYENKSPFEIFEQCIERDLDTCESCGKKFEYSHDTCGTDDDSNYFCSECWKELLPAMQKEYEELKLKGGL